MSADELLEELTQKQRAFAEAYCSNGGNGLRAVFQAGYGFSTDKAAATEANRLLKKPNVIAYIRHLQASVSRRFDISTDRLVQELAAYVFTDSADIYDDEGKLKPLSEIPKNIRRTINEIQTEERFDRDGNPIRKSKAKTPDKVRALELLAKITGASSELNLALACLEKYGIRLRQMPDGKWSVEDE